MYSKFLTLILLVTLFHSINGQTIGEAGIGDWTGDPKQITVINLPAPTVVGSNYLSEDWYLGSIKLKSKSILSNYNLKYDVENNNLEIKDGDSTKICTLILLDSFYWQKTSQSDSILYVNADKFTVDDYKQIIGMLKVVSYGKVNLFSRSYIEILQPTYNAALNVGERNKKAVIRSAFYLSRYNNLVKIKSKKQLLSYFNDDAKQIEVYLKTNKLKIKNEDDFKKVIDFYNSKF